MPFQTVYGPEVREAVLNSIRQGKSLRAISEEDGMPSPALVVTWVKDDPAYAEQYARAKEVQAHLMAEEILEIADDGTNDKKMVGKEGQEYEVTDQEVIGRSRLRVDSRKWLLSKMLPKVYGDKLDLSIPEGLTINVNKRTDAGNANG